MSAWDLRFVAERSSLFALSAVVLVITGLAARRHRSCESLFLGSRAIGGGTLAVSLLANRSTTVSLFTAPAFVAVGTGGGLSWLQSELAVPLAMLVVLAVFVRPLRALPSCSIYAFLERRFDAATRRFVGVLFIVVRAISLGLVLAVSARTISLITGWSPTTAVIGVGMFAAIYASLGGVTADVWTDLVQVLVMWGACIATAGYLSHSAGTGLLKAVPAERFRALWLQGSEAAPHYSFWPMFIGGFFLTVSTTGTDQVVAQRLLAARSDRDARFALTLSGLLRFPLVGSFCLLGLFAAGWIGTLPAAVRDSASLDELGLLPTVVMSLPAGFRGAMAAALFAAATSLIDSSLLSLGAVTLEDLLDRSMRRTNVWVGRFVTLGWGCTVTGVALALSPARSDAVDLIGRWSSFFAGPVLALFTMGVVTCDVSGRSARIGLFAGLAANLLMATAIPSVAWMWWNPVGFAVTVGVALAITPGWMLLRTVRWPAHEAPILIVTFSTLLGLLIGLSWR
jgi:Na+/proline symporter